MAGGPGRIVRGGRNREGEPPGRRAKFRSRRCPPALLACEGPEAGRARKPPAANITPGAAGALRGERTALRLAGLRAGLALTSASCASHFWFIRCGFISSGRDGSRRGPQWRSRGNLENGQKKVASLFHFRIFHCLRDLGCVFLCPGTEISEQGMMILILI